METRFDLPERLRYLRCFGGQALSYSTLQPGMRYFDVDGVGYIAYQVKFGRRFVLGDPICTPGDMSLLIERFLAENSNSVFLPVPVESAVLLHEAFGFFATQIGCETYLELASWSPRGRRMRNFRRAVAHADRLGIEVTEVEVVDPDEVRHVSEEWRHGRRLRKRWLTFMSRPVHAEPASGVRKFLARLDGRLIGYVFFDPIFANKQVVAYGPSLSAFTTEFCKGQFYLMLEHASRRFREQGVQHINLGLSPLDIVAPAYPFESCFFRYAISGMRLTGDQLYNFRGLSFIKRKFYGKQVPVFAAHRSRLPMTDLIGFLRLSRII